VSNAGRSEDTSIVVVSTHSLGTASSSQRVEGERRRTELSEGERIEHGVCGRVLVGGKLQSIFRMVNQAWNRLERVVLEGWVRTAHTEDPTRSQKRPTSWSSCRHCAGSEKRCGTRIGRSQKWSGWLGCGRERRWEWCH